MVKSLTIFALAMLFISCGTSQPAPVTVIGPADDIVQLAGQWTGTYDSPSTGRQGSITFYLTASADGAHGDVLMTPARDIVFDQERHHQAVHQPMISSSMILAIDFVRVSAREVSGRIAPYPDPEMPAATLETHFTGHIDGDWIEGTFVTYSDQGASPRRGKWRVHRKQV